MALYKDLLGHNLEKFGAVTVFDATFYDVDKNVPLITFDTLTVSNISVEAEQKEIRGGQGANLLVTYDYGKNAQVEITDALASMYSLQYLTGGKLEGAFTAMIRREANKVDTDWVVPIEPAEDGKDATVMVIYTDGHQEYKTLKITKATKKLAAITPAALKTIDKVFVYYEAEFSNGTAGVGADVTKSHVNKLTITGADFPPTVRLIGETIFVDAKNGKLIQAQIEIPKFKLASNFELTFEAEGDASVFDFSGTALVHNNELIIIRTLGHEDDAAKAYDKGGDVAGDNPEDNWRAVTLIYEVNGEPTEFIVYVKDGEALEDFLPLEFLDYEWYDDEGLDPSDLYDISTPVEEDITLYGVTA